MSQDFVLKQNNFPFLMSVVFCKMGGCGWGPDGGSLLNDTVGPAFEAS